MLVRERRAEGADREEPGVDEDAVESKRVACVGTPRASWSTTARTPYWSARYVAIPASAPATQVPGLLSSTAWKIAPAASAGPTKFAMLKRTMYPGTRVRIHSGSNAAAIATAASSGGSSRAAANIGASETCDPWWYSRSCASRCTRPTTAMATANAIQSSVVIRSGGPRAIAVLTTVQTMTNSNAAAAALSPPGGVLRRQPPSLRQAVGDAAHPHPPYG